MSTSLEKLVNNLAKGDTLQFRGTRKVFNNNDIELVTRNGVYCYEYTDSWEKLRKQHYHQKNTFAVHYTNQILTMQIINMLYEYLNILIVRTFVRVRSTINDGSSNSRRTYTSKTYAILSGKQQLGSRL